MINFNTSKEDTKIIMAIVKRGFNPDIYKDRMSMMMDISATHLNGCPLKLNDLLEADDFNFFHDIYGIASHLNRETGELEDCFLPRFAQPQKN